MVSSSSSFEMTLAVQLRLVGNGLLSAPSSVDELLTLLDNAEDILVDVKQEPSDFLQDALLPVMKGLIAEALFKHCNEDVRVTVASCLSEILRITSPQQPFDDDRMKAIFELIVEALSKLSQPSTRCYEKAFSILKTIARVKACLLMLDLESEVLVARMCRHFWAFARSNPSADACWAVEQIMTDILAESEEIGPDLLSPLLDSVLKENEKVAPSCWRLGEKLISKCAAKLRPILRGALQSKGSTLDDYSPAVALLYRNESTTEHNDTSGCPKQGIADYRDAKGPILPQKKERKPNSLMRIKEGYDLSWLYREGQTFKQPHKRRISLSRTNLSEIPTFSTIKRRTALKSNVRTVQGEAALIPIDLRERKMKLPTEGGNSTIKGTSRELGVLADGLVGRRIKVWWPLDEMFYDGRIQSYNHMTKKHKVFYDDGDRETLNLEMEQWEFIEDDLPDEHRQMADNPKPITSSIVPDYHLRLRKQNTNDRSFQSMRILDGREYVKRARAATRLQEVEEAPNFGNQNIGGDESSDDESTEDYVFEFRPRSKDGRPENPRMSRSDDSTPEATPLRVVRVGSKDLRLKNPGTSTSNYSTPEASLLRHFREKSKDVRLQSISNDSTPEASPPRYNWLKAKDVQLQSTSDDSTPEGSPPRPWGLWRSWRH